MNKLYVDLCGRRVLDIEGYRSIWSILLCCTVVHLYCIKWIGKTIVNKWHGVTVFIHLISDGYKVDTLHVGHFILFELSFMLAHSTSRAVEHVHMCLIGTGCSLDLVGVVSQTAWPGSLV